MRGRYYVFSEKRVIDRRNGGRSTFDVLVVRRSRLGDDPAARLSGPHGSRKEAWDARRTLRPVWEVMRS